MIEGMATVVVGIAAYFILPSVFSSLPSPSISPFGAILTPRLPGDHDLAH
jgi:hypothetical protein